jgi:hypothetical protein
MLAETLDADSMLGLLWPQNCYFIPADRENGVSMTKFVKQRFCRRMSEPGISCLVH